MYARPTCYSTVEIARVHLQSSWRGGDARVLGEPPIDQVKVPVMNTGRSPGTDSVPVMKSAAALVGANDIVGLIRPGRLRGRVKQTGRTDRAVRLRLMPDRCSSVPPVTENHRPTSESVAAPVRRAYHATRSSSERTDKCRRHDVGTAPCSASIARLLL